MFNVACIGKVPSRPAGGAAPPAPEITSLDYASSWDGGGHTVTLTGTNFVDGCTVLFGTTPAASVNFINDTTVEAVTPAHAAGSVDVTLTNPDAQLDVLVAAYSFEVFRLELGTPGPHGIPWQTPPFRHAPPDTASYRLESSLDDVDYYPQTDAINSAGLGSFDKTPDVSDGDPFSLGYESTLNYLRLVAVDGTNDDLLTSAAESATTVGLPGTPDTPVFDPDPLVEEDAFTVSWGPWPSDTAEQEEFFDGDGTTPPVSTNGFTPEIGRDTNHYFTTGELHVAMAVARNIYGETAGTVGTPNY